MSAPPVNVSGVPVSGFVDLRQPTCPVCGFVASLRWARHLADIAQLAIPPGMRMAGLVVRCEECNDVVPFWFTADLLDPVAHEPLLATVTVERA